MKGCEGIEICAKRLGRGKARGNVVFVGGCSEWERHFASFLMLTY